MQKKVIPKSQLAAARNKLIKTYGIWAVEIVAVFLLTCICAGLVLCSLFPTWTLLFSLFAVFSIIVLWFMLFPESVASIDEMYQLWKLKKDIRRIIRDAYGYATEENVGSINRVVSTILDHTNCGKFHNASKEYYNLLALSPVETAAIYGDSYLSIGSCHIRLPLAA